MDNYCSEKCGYSFNYPALASCNCTYYGTFLEVTNIPSGNTPPVTFDAKGYNVASMTIYRPSVHRFNGDNADGELVITHTPSTSGPILKVCIPLMGGVQSTDGGQFITDIIKGSVLSLHAVNDNTMLRLDNHSLNSVVPSSSYFFYQSDDGTTSIIVYGLTSAVVINTSVMNSLASLVEPASAPSIFPAVANLEYNKGGPSSGDTNEEYYMDCQPTGNSEETEGVFFSKKADIINDMSLMLSSEMINYVLLIIIFVTVLFAVFQGIKLLSGQANGSE
jgi:hypothetical protein